MYRLILALILFYPLLGYSKCMYPPKHTFTMEVHTCQKVTFDASISKYESYYHDYEQGEAISGVILTGIVLNNHYDSDNQFDYISKWQDGDKKNIFINKMARKYCKRTLPVKINFEDNVPCCDVLPHKGICLVPLIIVKENSTK